MESLYIKFRLHTLTAEAQVQSSSGNEDLRGKEHSLTPSHQKQQGGVEGRKLEFEIRYKQLYTQNR